MGDSYVRKHCKMVNVTIFMSVIYTKRNPTIPVHNIRMESKVSSIDRSRASVESIYRILDSDWEMLSQQCSLRKLVLFT